jgi:ubiquinone biosynthesis protein COQ9
MKNTTQIRDEILDRLIPHVPFDGWTRAAADLAAQEAGYEASMVDAAFPQGMDDVVSHFADLADRAMLEALGEAADMRVRDKITRAVQKRLEWLEQQKEAERAAVAYWMRPIRKYKGAKIVWRTADRIWVWAGDTATDYNRYTKRILLSGVLTSTTLYWLGGKSMAETFAFLDRRIDNVLELGSIIGRVKKRNA